MDKLHPDAELIAVGAHAEVYRWHHKPERVDRHVHYPSTGGGRGPSAVLSDRDEEVDRARTNTKLSGATTRPCVSRTNIYAVKVINAGPSGKRWDTVPHDAVKEVRVLSRLKHPNIIELIQYKYDSSLSQHRLYLPFLPITLRHLLDSPLLADLDHLISTGGDATLSNGNLIASASDFANLLFRISYQLLTGVRYLHSAGIAHRDVKPENIMFDHDGTVVIIDFGTAWDCEELGSGVDVAKGAGGICETTAGNGATVTAIGEWKNGDHCDSGNEDVQSDQIDSDRDTDADCVESPDNMYHEVGTGPYRAPELLFAPTSYNAQSTDLWSVGCIIAELLRPSQPRGTHLNSTATPDESTTDHRAPFVEPASYPDLIRGQNEVIFHRSSHTNQESDSDSSLKSKSSSSVGDTDSEWNDEPVQSQLFGPLFDDSFGTLGLAGSVFGVLGTPTEESWPTFHLLPDAARFEFDFRPSIPLEGLLPRYRTLDAALDILNATSQSRSSSTSSPSSPSSTVSTSSTSAPIPATAPSTSSPPTLPRQRLDVLIQTAERLLQLDPAQRMSASDALNRLSSLIPAPIKRDVDLESEALLKQPNKAASVGGVPSINYERVIQSRGQNLVRKDEYRGCDELFKSILQRHLQGELGGRPSCGGDGGGDADIELCTDGSFL